MRGLLIRLLFLPTLVWNLLLHRLLPRRRWWDQVDELLILGALPFASDVPALARAGVKAVLNLCAEYAGPVEAYAGAGIVQRRILWEDFTTPTVEQLEEAVAFVTEQTRRGARVYVHCKAGRGRAAAVALCWLVAARGKSAQEAEAWLRERRPHVVSGLHRRAPVQEFARRHGRTNVE